MKNELDHTIRQSAIIRSNPKYLPEGTYTMRLGGITTNKIKTPQGHPYYVNRLHFFIDIRYHGHRSFYRQYDPEEAVLLHQELQNYLGELYPLTTRSLKKRLGIINNLKGRYADVRLTSEQSGTRLGLISNVTEFHGYGFFRHQEFLANQHDIGSRTLLH